MPVLRSPTQNPPPCSTTPYHSSTTPSKARTGRSESPDALKPAEPKPAGTLAKPHTGPPKSAKEALADQGATDKAAVARRKVAAALPVHALNQALQATLSRGNAIGSKPVSSTAEALFSESRCANTDGWAISLLG